MVRHFIVGRDSPEPKEWDPRNPDPQLPKDCVYFGKVLSEFEKHITDDICCYLTWDNDSLPQYGDHVVAILIGEEWGLIPRYARHVRVVARVMGRAPFLGVRQWWPPDRLTVLLTVKHMRNWLRHLRSWLRYLKTPSSWPDRVHKKGVIVHLPWGSASLVDVPMKSMRERSRNYFFSGGITTGADTGYRRLLSTPKMYSRKAMVDAVAKIEAKHSRLAADRAISVKNTPVKDSNDDREYAQRMMDSKVCLAPRGSVADTWRYFEGLKSGCAVITNPLPDEWYYRDAPVIQIDRWSQLESALVPLLSDNTRLERIHSQAVQYWETVCGEKAVGRFLADALKRGDSDKGQSS
jgi:hypothetical protein